MGSPLQDAAGAAPDPARRGEPSTSRAAHGPVTGAPRGRCAPPARPLPLHGRTGAPELATALAVVQPSGAAGPCPSPSPVGRSAEPVAVALPGAILVALVAVLLGCGAALVSIPQVDGDLGAVGDLPGPTSAAVTTTEVDAEAPPPRRVTVERLGVDSDLTGLRVQPDGTLDVPGDADQVGWHRAGTAPGDVGPAVLVGHVDSYEGPGVFHRLRELQPGDRVAVTRTDGSTVDFEVYGLETVPKSRFPTDRVYGPTAGPELRLITCGGGFDEAARSYTDNIVAYARIVAPAAAS